MFRKLFIMVLGLVLLGGFAVAEAGGGKGKLVLRIDTDGFATFDDGAPGPLGGFPFYVSGIICEELVLLGPCTQIGSFHCWGWDTGTGLAVVAQEFDLWGRGKIQVQGVEDTGPRAVTGGTGDFRNVRGEGTGFDFSEFLEPDFNGEFIATFKLLGVKHKRGHH